MYVISLSQLGHDEELQDEVIRRSHTISNRPFTTLHFMFYSDASIGGTSASY